MIVWLLWRRRNQIRVGTSVTSLGQIVARAQQQLQDYNQVQPVKPLTKTVNLHTTATWSPPQAPFLKINYDGAVFQDSNNVGIGAMIRDNEAVATLGILSRVFLFHFEKISGNFSLFQ